LRRPFPRLCGPWRSWRETILDLLTRTNANIVFGVSSSQLTFGGSIRTRAHMRSLLKFFALTYIVSWILWIASAAILRMATPQPTGVVAISGFLYLLGVFAPSLVALALTVREDGRARMLELLGRTVKWEVGARWYVFALTYMAAVKLATATLLRIATGAWPGFGQEPVYIMAIALVFSTPVQAGEEIGWRGYALPRLSAGLGLPGAGIVLGVIWACWHLPFFIISGNEKTGQSFPLYLLTVIPLSVGMAWLYWRTSGSLLLTMLMHAAINNTMNIVPSAVSDATSAFSLSSSRVAWLSVALLWICAAYFLIRMRGVKLPYGRQAAADISDTASARSSSRASV
jgi:membrane protease YdiL (CAAX protease family)